MRGDKKTPKWRLIKLYSLKKYEIFFIEYIGPTVTSGRPVVGCGTKEITTVVLVTDDLHEDRIALLWIELLESGSHHHVRINIKMWWWWWVDKSNDDRSVAIDWWIRNEKETIEPTTTTKLLQNIHIIIIESNMHRGPSKTELSF